MYDLCNAFGIGIQVAIYIYIYANARTGVLYTARGLFFALHRFLIIFAKLVSLSATRDHLFIPERAQ